MRTFSRPGEELSPAPVRREGECGVLESACREETRSALAYPRIGILENDEGYRRFLETVMGETPGIRLAFAAGSGMRPLAMPRADVILVGLRNADQLGRSLVRAARSQWPEARLIVLWPRSEAEQSLSLLEMGALGYLLKPCLFREIMEAIGTVSRGGSVMAPEVAMVVASYFKRRGEVAARLTPREREVLDYFCAGLSQAETALCLGVSPCTERRHVHNLLEKLGVESTLRVLPA